MIKISIILFVVFSLIAFLKLFKFYLDNKPKRLILHTNPIKARSHGVAMDVMPERVASAPIFSVPSVPINSTFGSLGPNGFPIPDVPSVPFVSVESVESVVAPSVEASHYRRAEFMTVPELRFSSSLVTALAGRAHLMAKVRLADLAQPVQSRHNSAWQIAFNHIQSKHVDFVLCDFSFRPLCVIELDDSSHFRFNRVKRDHLVDQVLADIGLPIFHIRTKSSYSPDDFKALDSVLK